MSAAKKPAADAAITTTATPSAVQPTPPPAAIVHVPKPEDSFTIAPRPPRKDDDGNEVPTGGGVPYVGVRSSAGDAKNGDRAAALDALGIGVGDLYLFDGQPIKIKPFQAHILRLDRFYTKQNPAGDLVDARREWSQQDHDAYFREQIFCILAVVLPPTGPNQSSFYRAATARFRNAQCRGVNYAAEAVAKTTQPGALESFARLSPNHDAASKAVHPAGRLRAKLWALEEDSDNGTFIIIKSATQTPPAIDVPAFNEWYTRNIKPGGELLAALAAHEKYAGEVRDLIAANEAKKVKQVK